MLLLGLLDLELQLEGLPLASEQIVSHRHAHTFTTHILLRLAKLGLKITLLRLQILHVAHMFIILLVLFLEGLDVSKNEASFLTLHLLVNLVPSEVLFLLIFHLLILEKQ